MKQTLMKIKPSNLIYGIIFFSGMGIGLLWGDVSYLSFDWKVSLGELASLLMAIIVGFYIPFYLDHTINNKRTEKDLLIESFVELENDLKNQLTHILDLMAKTSPITKEEATRTLLMCTITRKTLARLINNCEKYTESENIIQTINDLERINYNYWLDLTPNLTTKKPSITPKSYIKTTDNIGQYLSLIMKMRLQLNDF